MSIFDIEKSDVEKRYDNIISKSGNVFKGEKNRCICAFNDLWGYNGIEGEPITIEEAQEVLDKFGTDASQLFQIHALWQQFIKSVDSSWVDLVPPYDFLINEDGTVVLSVKEG